MMTLASSPVLHIHSATPDRWPDLEGLFGPRGCGGCWCMWWKLPRSEFDRNKGDGNRQALKALVDLGQAPGILAYDASEAVGWCAVAPREQYPVLQRSRILAPVDDQPVWSIVCFFIARSYRGRGLLQPLIEGAVGHVRQSGGSVVEAYPTDTRAKTSPSFIYTGVLSAFLQTGFVEVARRSPTRPIVRRWLS